MQQMQPEEVIRSIIEFEAELQEEVADEERKAAAWLASRRSAMEAELQQELQGITEGLSLAGRQRLEDARALAAQLEAEAVRREERLNASTDSTLVSLVTPLLKKALHPEQA